MENLEQNGRKPVIMFVVGRQRVGKTVFLNVLAQYAREHGADFEIWDADISNASNNLSALHPVGPIITGGLVAHPFERARDMLRFYREITASLPDEHTVFAGLIHAPDGSGTKLAAMVSCHAGTLTDGEVAG